MRKLAIATSVLLFAALVWYLFFKSHDYRVTFQAKASTGTINQTIKTWNKTLDSAEVMEVEDIDLLTQKLKFGDSTHLYEWQLTPINDSVTRIRVYAKDLNHSFYNKMSIPFTDTDFEKRTRRTLLDFNEKLEEHLDKFKVSIDGEGVFGPIYCAYVEVTTDQYGKADGMMKNYPFLGTFLVNNKVGLNGPPFIEITHWNVETDSLQYNFCYPVILSDSLPQHPELKYKEISATKALKATYNGNYITSDRAWYALLNEADKRDIPIVPLPIEVFHNNPNAGGNELNWKAEIYMPLKAPSNE